MTGRINEGGYGAAEAQGQQQGEQQRQRPYSQRAHTHAEQQGEQQGVGYAGPDDGGTSQEELELLGINEDSYSQQAMASAARVISQEELEWIGVVAHLQPQEPPLPTQPQQGEQQQQHGEQQQQQVREEQQNAAAAVDEVAPLRAQLRAEQQARAREAAEMKEKIAAVKRATELKMRGRPVEVLRAVAGLRAQLQAQQQQADAELQALGITVLNLQTQLQSTAEALAQREKEVAELMQQNVQLRQELACSMEREDSLLTTRKHPQMQGGAAVPSVAHDDPDPQQPAQQQAQYVGEVIDLLSESDEECEQPPAWCGSRHATRTMPVAAGLHPLPTSPHVRTARWPHRNRPQQQLGGAGGAKRGAPAAGEAAASKRVRVPDILQHASEGSQAVLQQQPRPMPLATQHGLLNLIQQVEHHPSAAGRSKAAASQARHGLLSEAKQPHAMPAVEVMSEFQCEQLVRRLVQEVQAPPEQRHAWGDVVLHTKVVLVAAGAEHEVVSQVTGAMAACKSIEKQRAFAQVAVQGAVRALHQGKHARVVQVMLRGLKWLV